jgi:CTP synthase
VHIEWINSEELEKGQGLDRLLAAVDGIVVPGGFGYRGIEGKIVAARYARQKIRPALSGAVPGHAGDVHRVCPPRLSVPIEPNSTEFDPQHRAIRSST